MKITIEPTFTYKSGITCNRLTCKTEFGGRGGSKVIFDNNIYAKEPLLLIKLFLALVEMELKIWMDSFVMEIVSRKIVRYLQK